jgi:hypothetical protein
MTPVITKKRGPGYRTSAYAQASNLAPERTNSGGTQKAASSRPLRPVTTTMLLKPLAKLMNASGELPGYLPIGFQVCASGSGMSSDTIHPAL